MHWRWNRMDTSLQIESFLFILLWFNGFLISWKANTCSSIERDPNELFERGAGTPPHRMLWTRRINYLMLFIFSINKLFDVVHFFKFHKSSKDSMTISWWKLLLDQIMMCMFLYEEMYSRSNPLLKLMFIKAQYKGIQWFSKKIQHMFDYGGTCHW